MIISASRRTDIPTFYGEWFMNRLREEYCLVANPFNPAMVSRVSLALADVDVIVFWSKSPEAFFLASPKLTVWGSIIIFCTRSITIRKVSNPICHRSKTVSTHSANWQKISVQPVLSGAMIR